MLRRFANPDAVRRFLRDEAGATAVEYALMTALIATVIVASVAAVGSRLAEIFTDTAAAF